MNEEFSKRLKKLRLDKKLTYAEMSKILKVSSVSLGYYERGERVPDIDTLTTLCKYFNVSSDYLLGLDDYREPVDNSLLKELGLSEKAMNNLLTLTIKSDDVLDDNNEIDSEKARRNSANRLKRLIEKHNADLYIANGNSQDRYLELLPSWDNLVNAKKEFINFLLENDRCFSAVSKSLSNTKKCKSTNENFISSLKELRGSDDTTTKEKNMIHEGEMLFKSYYSYAVFHCMVIADLFIFGAEHDLADSIHYLSEWRADNGNDNKA